MSETLRIIRELAGELGVYAADLDSRRADHPVSRAPAPGSDDATLWGGSLGAGAAKVNGTSFWFDGVEPIYAELDELIRFAPPDVSESILSDAHIKALAPEIHRVRAAFERDKELIQARALVNADDGLQRLQAMIAQESYWALGAELRSALAGSRHILVAGSGPLPLTALCIAAELDVRVTCLEHDPECHLLGQQLIALTGRAERFKSVSSDILHMTDFEPYDAIVGVVLLGVSTSSAEASAKSAIAQHIIEHMSPGTRMVMRDPHGLGMLLYPSVDLDENLDVDFARHVPKVGPDHPYRSGLVVAKRRSKSAGHAH